MRSSTALVILSVLASASAAPIESQQQDKRWCIWGWGTTCNQVTTTAVASSAKATSTAVVVAQASKVSSVVKSSAISSASAVKSSAAAAVVAAPSASASSAAAAVQVKWDACKGFDWSPWSTGWSWSGYNLNYVKAWYLDTYGTNPPTGYTWGQVSSLVSAHGKKTIVALPKSTYKAGGGCVNPWSKPTAAVSVSASSAKITAAASSAVVVAKPASSAAASSAAAVVAKPASSAAASSAAASVAAAPSAAVSSAAAASSVAAVVAPAPSAAASSSAAAVVAAPSAAASSAAAPDAAAPSVADNVAAPAASSTAAVVAAPSVVENAAPAAASSTDTVASGSGSGSAGSPGTGAGSNAGSGSNTDAPAAAPTTVAPVAPVYLSTGYSSAGCFQEVDGRLLARVQTADPVQTLEKCTALCAANGFQVAGLEYGSECYCGDVADLDDALESGECKMACSGDASQICGGPNAINVYINPSIQAKTVIYPAGWSNYGNVAEGSNGRTLTYFAYSDNSNTNVKCAATCANLGYTVSGTEYTSECFCGNGFSNGGGAFAQTQTMPCGGDSAQICGGSNLLTIATSLSSIPTL